MRKLDHQMEGYALEKSGSAPTSGYHVEAKRIRVREPLQAVMHIERPSEHITDVWTRYKTEPRIQDRNRLITQYSLLVKYNAERIWARLPDGVELDDLISAGTFGLMDAIDNFDIERGIKFETYCVPRIRGAMLDELRTMDWVPRLARARYSKMTHTIEAAQRTAGKPLSYSEKAKAMGMTEKEFGAFLKENHAVGILSLNKKLREKETHKDMCEIDILEDRRAPQPDENLGSEDFMKAIMSGLNSTERTIITSYYQREMTMKQIGEMISLSESRVSQMHASVIHRMKNILKERPHLAECVLR